MKGEDGQPGLPGNSGGPGTPGAKGEHANNCIYGVVCLHISSLAVTDHNAFCVNSLLTT